MEAQKKDVCLENKVSSGRKVMVILKDSQIL